MKGIVIYKSKYGATAQYAQWIASELNLPVAETNDLDGGLLNIYDTVVIGSSVYIGKLLIQKWLKKHLSDIIGKKIILFVVSGTPISKKEKLDAYLKASVPAAILNTCSVYFLPGKLIQKELSRLDHFLLKMGARLTKEEQTKKGMLTDYNEVKKENITDLVTAVKRTPADKSKTSLTHPAAAY